MGKKKKEKKKGKNISHQTPSNTTKHFRSIRLIGGKEKRRPTGQEFVESSSQQLDARDCVLRANNKKKTL
jgi:hypothetical protein